MLSLLRRLLQGNLLVVAMVIATTATATAATTYLVASNGQIGPGTVSGHQPPPGAHANVMSGTLTGRDVADGSLTGRDVKPGTIGRNDLRHGALHSVSGPAQDCSGGVTAVYCDATGGASWAVEPASGPVVPVSYWKDTDGTVHLQGTVLCSGGASSTNPSNFPSIFYLPAGYRPSGGIVFPELAGSAITRVHVDGTGSVKWWGGGDCSMSVSLSGIAFRAG